jgi:uncharacterized protein YbjT (DUF2867 family)
MTYLITGATGEVGSLVVRQLLERHIRPRVLVRSEEKARSLFGDRVDVCVGDLAAPVSMRGAIQGADTVFLVNVGPAIPERDKHSCEENKQRSSGQSFPEARGASPSLPIHVFQWRNDSALIQC